MSVSVLLLLPGLGSVTSGGGITMAVLTRTPEPKGVTSTVKMTVAPAGRSTVVARLPVPLVGPVTAPPPVAPTDAQVVAVTLAGRASKTLAPVAVLGPALLTTMV